VTVVKIETPREYFDHVVNLDVDDLVADPTDIRLAYHACISLLSLRDWILTEYRTQPWSWQTKAKGHLKTKREFQKALNAIDNNFAIVTDIANASKHMVLEPDQSQTKLWGSANVEIKEVTIARGGALFGSALLGTFAYNQPPTVYTSDRIQVKIDAAYFDVLTCVTKVRSIWVTLLQENTW
jgi:hypothetical protein